MLLDVKGVYIGNEINVIYVVLLRFEIVKFKNIVYGFDKGVLIIILSVEGIGKRYVKKVIY